MRKLALVAAVLATTLAEADDGELAALAALRKSARDRRATESQLVAEAHRTLDGGDFDRSVALIASAQAAELEARRADEAASILVAAIVSELVPRLDDDRFDVRQAATVRLLRLGSKAKLVLLEASRRQDLGAEARARLREVLDALPSIDDDGRLRQWAVTARASSEYTDTRWSAQQATGEPDTLVGGDAPTAWASKEANAGEEWLELDYSEGVRPTAVRVRETYNPGAVVKVEARDAGGTWHVLWEGADPTAVCPGWLEVKVPASEWTARTIKVTLDTRKVSSWCEIDAVELVGEWELPSAR
jgi:hypothetical protein